MSYLYSALIGFAFGSLPFGYWIASVNGIADIRQHGSGNIGASNIWRVVGHKAGILVLMLDILKGSAPVLLAITFAPEDANSDYLGVIAGLAAVLGHVFTPLLNFRGGKGVNTTLGVLIVLIPLETVAALGIFTVTVYISRYISLGSITASVSLVCILTLETIFFEPHPETIYLVLSVLLASVILYAHRENIRRIANGTERKFSLSGKAQ